VVGVDELDVAKADGDFIYRIHSDGSTLSVLKRAPIGEAAVVENLPLNEFDPAGLFVTATKVILIGNSFPSVSPPEIHVLLYSRGSGGTLTPTGERKIDGMVTGARMIGEMLHLVAELYVEPFGGSDGVSSPSSEEALPASSFGADSPSKLCGCTDVLYEPRTADDEEHLPTLNSLVGVLSMNVEDPTASPTGEWVAMNSASTIYASASNLFVASYGWDGVLPIHQFALSDGSSPTKYVGTALVNGYLLSQFSMDESDGIFRVATTEPPAIEPLFFNGERVAASSPPETWANGVTTFRLNGGDPEPIGKLTGFGNGEQIFAVRFVGDVGYVVTFRQTDPLFTIDLSDPAAPGLRGELVMPGYSAYLHPIADGYLLGVGQKGDENGTLGLGMQMSIFDVRDLDHPILAHTIVIGEGYVDSEVLRDAKAFRFIPEHNLAVLPVSLGTETGERFQIYNVSPASGFSLAGESVFARQTGWSLGNRSFFHNGEISLVGGGELVLRNATAPAINDNWITIE
jgi:hypothetical protein